MSDLKVITNNVPRLIIDEHELTAEERAQFDYLDWPAIDRGADSATFFRYKGTLYDLGEFLAISSPDLKEWDGIATDTFFSATLVRYYREDNDYVIVGRCYS